MKTTTHIVFVSLPMLGHANQMIALAQELICRGCQVSFVMPESASKWIAHIGCDFIPWEPPLETSDETIYDRIQHVVRQMSIEQSVWRGDELALKFLSDLYIPMYRALEPIFQKCQPDLLIVDRAAIPAMDLAERLDLPFIIQTRFLGNFVKTDSKYPRFRTSYPNTNEFAATCSEFPEAAVSGVPLVSWLLAAQPRSESLLRQDKLR